MGEAVNLGNMNASPGGINPLSGGGGMGGAAGAASIASLGLSAFGSIKKGEGQQASAEFQAARAARAAEFGRTQADLTDTHFREELNTTLGNIEVMRAAARIDPTSPTTAVLEDRQSLLSNRQRTAAVTSLRGQAAEDEASARYLREAGDYSLKMGYLDAGIKVASGVAKAFV